MPINQSLSAMPVKNSQKKGNLNAIIDQELTEIERNCIEKALNHPKADKLLTDKDQLFVAYFIESGQAKESALKAGYSKSVAVHRAKSWTNGDIERNPKLHVFKAIYLARQKTLNRAIGKAANHKAKQLIDASYIMEKTVELIDKNNGDIPTHKTYTRDKEGNIIEQEHYKYNANAVGKGIELLGKHRQVKAFDNTIEHTANDSLAGLLSNLKPTLKPNHLIEGQASQIVDGELIEEGSETDHQDDDKPSLLPPGNIPPAPK